jgi:hypothetical protein
MNNQPSHNLDGLDVDMALLKQCVFRPCTRTRVGPRDTQFVLMVARTPSLPEELHNEHRCSWKLGGNAFPKGALQ